MLQPIAALRTNAGGALVGFDQRQRDRLRVLHVDVCWPLCAKLKHVHLHTTTVATRERTMCQGHLTAGSLASLHIGACDCGTAWQQRWVEASGSTVSVVQLTVMPMAADSAAWTAA